MNEQQINLLYSQLEKEQLARSNAENNMMKNANMTETNNQNIVELQLNVDKIKTEMKNHLLGKELIFDSNGDRWIEPNDDRTRIWSDIGVKQIMSIVHFYVNPVVLLSCFTEEQINQKMITLGEELNDLIFSQLETFLYYPTPEQLFEKYYKIISEYPDELSGLTIQYEDGTVAINERALYNKCVEWSIKELRAKENYYPITLLKIIDMIHATYLRALNGEERDSLRKQMMIHQNLQDNSNNAMPQKKGLFK